MDCSVELYQSFIDVPCWLRHVLIWTYFQQTLLAGVGALLAAWITIRHIRRQIQQNEDHRRDEIERIHVAHKIEAIWAVTLVAEYAELCLGYIKRTAAQKDTLKYAKVKSDNVPEFPINTLEAISKLAYGLDTCSAEKVRAFVGHAQIQHARLNSLVSDMSGNQKTPNGSPITGHSFSLIEAKLEYFILNFQCNRVLGYCRGDYPSIPNLPDTIEFLREASFGYFNLTESEKEYLRDHWPINGWVKVSNV